MKTIIKQIFTRLLIDLIELVIFINLKITNTLTVMLKNTLKANIYLIKKLLIIKER